MLKYFSLKSIAVAAVTASLIACGGGGSGGSNGGSNGGSDYESVIDNPRSNSSSALVQAYDQKISETTSQNTDEPTITPEIAQYYFQKTFGADNSFFGAVDLGELLSLPDGTAVNETVDCDLSGQATINGTVNYAEDSVIQVNFNNCKDFDADTNGGFSIRLKSSDGNSYFGSYSYDAYFDDLEVTDNFLSVRVTGYAIAERTYNDQTGNDSFEGETNLMIVDLLTSETVVENLVTTSTYDGALYNVNVEGSIWSPDYGSVAAKFEITQDFAQGIFEEVVEFTGENQVLIEDVFGQNVRYLVDTTGDGEFDSGSYVSGNDWNNHQALEVELVAIEDLSLPPSIYSGPEINGFNLTTLDQIVVGPGYYEDSDTPVSEISISYRWYLNDELLVGYTDATLPARVAVFGDSLQVSMVVSDGSSEIESSRSSVYLNDSPATLDVSDLPSVTNVGDVIEFSVIIYDPDLGDSGVAPTMSAAPAGAMIDDSGFVSWTAAESDNFLPQTAYIFTFTDPSLSEPIELEVFVNNPQARLPIARSGIEVPYDNYSMWVGDYDGDGSNEIVSMDDGNKVFTLTDVDGEYKQTWMYPFEMPTSGELEQVVHLDGRNGGNDEILVITEHGISRISNLDTPASIVLALDEQTYISFAAVADADNDGDFELAYLYSSDEYSSTKSLAVVDLSDGDVLLDISVGEAQEIAFGNVDTDSALEVVVNSGYVFDGVTWANEWFRGSSFGNNYIAVGDFNNDGVDEIAGAGNWSELSVYSAQTRSQILSIDSSDICALNAGQVDDSSEVKLLVGDCQWGDIHVYQLTGNSFTEIASFDKQGHGSKSLLAGDSDNDGQVEIHWGTGQSSTGEDSFVVADSDDTGNFTVRELTTSQLGSYSTAGWSNITPDSAEVAVFFSPRTESGYGNSAIITMTHDGEIDVLAAISSNWDISRLAFTTDFNNDGFGDILVPTTELYDGSFGVLQLSDQSVHWETEGSYDDNIGVVLAADMNNDGFEDALYENGATLTVVDLMSETLIGTYTASSHIRDFTVVQTAQQAHVVIASDNLELIDVGSGTNTIVDTVQQACSRVDVANIDDDVENEIICLGLQEWWDDEPSNLIAYDVSETGFTQIINIDLEVSVVDFVANNTSDFNQSLFILTHEENDNWPYDSWTTLGEMSFSDGLLWESPRLLGSANIRSMQFKAGEEQSDLLVSTTEAHVLVQSLA